jgi:putative transposase
MSKREIHLKPEERDRLVKLVSVGYHQANEMRRAYMLLHSDDGKTDQSIADLLFCSEDSVRRTRIRYLNEGLAAALEDKPRSGREPALNAQQEAYLIALTCSAPPDGQEHWTLELLTQRMIDDEQVETLSPETVRLTLKKTNSSLG